MLSAQRHVKHKVRAIINAKPEAESYGPFLELMFPPLPSAEAASAAAAAGCSPSTFTYLHYLSHWGRHGRPLPFKDEIATKTHSIKFVFPVLHFFNYLNLRLKFHF